jgi:hypothetical protein
MFERQYNSFVVRTETGIELDSCQPFTRGIGIRRESTVCIVEWLKSCSKGQPESTERTKDDEGECVADQPLSKCQ